MSSKTIIITGASRGIGLAIAKYLLSAHPPHNVVVLARSAEPLVQLQNEYPTQVEYVTGDIADFSLAETAVQRALSSFGRVDGLVLNHGVVAPVADVARADVGQWKSGFDVNFFSLVAFVKAALPSLRQSKGKVIFTSSGNSVNAYRGMGMYGATKAAMNHLAMTLAAEESDVTSISIRPGMVDTDMQREIRDEHRVNMHPDMYAKFEDAYKGGKLLRPEQPGHVMAKLALDAPHSLSGRYIDWSHEDLKAFQS